MPKPGGLPLGVAPGVALAAFCRFVERDLAREISDEPGHAMRLHRRQRRVEMTRRELSHFVERAGRQHGVEARVDAAVELGAIDVEKYLDGVGRIDRWRQALTMPVRER